MSNDKVPAAWEREFRAGRGGNGNHMEQKDEELFQYVLKKDSLKKQVSENTLQAFSMLRDEGKAFLERFRALRSERQPDSGLKLEYADRGAMEFSLRFSSDVLLFSLHTNVFEFSRLHEVMKTPYIREDADRSFCGLIHIYNFLADSMQYRRDNDLGYLIGRVFVNKDKHYFIEGKQELGLLYSSFGHSVFDAEAASKLIRASVEYTAKFDLLTPPYDAVKELSVGDALDELAYKKMRTGKRLGFQFKADQ